MGQPTRKATGGTWVLSVIVPNSLDFHRLMSTVVTTVTPNSTEHERMLAKCTGPPSTGCYRGAGPHCEWGGIVW